MNIKSLIESINPSKKLLTWIVTVSVAAIPTIWVLSGKIASDKTIEDSRLTKLEQTVNSIDNKILGLYDKFDKAEQRFTETYQNGVSEVGEIIKKSDMKQTDQLKFVINNWSEENKKLITEALEINQTSNEADLDKMIEEARQPSIYRGDPLIVPIDETVPEYKFLNGVDIIALDSLTGNYKIINVELVNDGKYNIQYRDFTSIERQKY